MPIKFNFNICDNSPECSGMAVCDYGAIYWDKEGLNVRGEKGTLRVDNNRCVSCSKCVSDEGCPVGAIVFAKTEDELAALIKNTEIDVNKVKALFVERYGAEPIDESVCVSIDTLPELLSKSIGITLVEEFADWSIQCLLTSIPIESIVQKVEILSRVSVIHYYKCDCSKVKSEGDVYPVLKVYTGSELVGQIDGYYDNAHIDDMIVAMEKILGYTSY